jgi:hypothetical protein
MTPHHHDYHSVCAGIEPETIRVPALHALAYCPRLFYLASPPGSPALYPSG